MIDRKALIHAIELRKEISKRNSQAFVDLPYEIVGNVITLLQEQEAVEPYITGNGESFEIAETWWYECGNCNKPIDVNDKFCRHCGRAVKWE